MISPLDLARELVHGILLDHYERSVLEYEVVEEGFVHVDGLPDEEVDDPVSLLDD